jgi:PPP family 3-phenylpropionic acid transporter
VPTELKTSDAPGHSGETIRSLNVAFVLMGAAESTVLPFIVLYLFERGFDAPSIGVVLAAAALASLVTSPLWAYGADRALGAERTVVVAAATAAAAGLVLGAAHGKLAVAVATVVLWVARSPFTSLLDANALHRLGGAGRSGYARIRLWMSAGYAVVAVVSGAVFQASSLLLLPYLYAPLVLVSGAWVWFALKPAARIRSERALSTLTGSVSIPRVPMALIGFLISTLLVGSAFMATQNFVTLRINILGGGALLIGAAAAFQALTEIPTMAYTHVLTRYLSHRVLYVVGCVIYVAVFVAWAFVSDALATALIKLVIGVGFALSYVASVQIADDLGPAHLRATAQAMVKAVSFGLAPIAGALGGGLLYGAIGSRGMFLVAAVITAGAAVVALIALPARPPGSGPQQHSGWRRSRAPRQG